jgi:hypothetical protein
MQKEYIPGIGRGIMLVFGTVIAAHALRYYAVGKCMARHRSQYQGSHTASASASPDALLMAPAALILGPLQFLPGLRARHPKLHRWSGRIYVLACVIGGAAALATSPSASGGSVAGLGFGTLAILWIGATVAAWISAVQGRLAWHRLLMRFSYAMSFGTVVPRLQIPIG